MKCSWPAVEANCRSRTFLNVRAALFVFALVLSGAVSPENVLRAQLLVLSCPAGCALAPESERSVLE